MSTPKDAIESTQETTKPSPETGKNESDHQWTIDVLIKEFHKESDRASVILTCSLIEEALTSLLRSFFTPSPSTDDSLLSNSNAPLSTFSSKIDIAFRLGLISNRLCRDLHLIRRIRNKFAHNVQGCSFEESDIKQRVNELEKSMDNLYDSRKTMKTKFETSRDSFLHLAGGILWAINEALKEVSICKDPKLEFIYK